MCSDNSFHRNFANNPTRVRSALVRRDRKRTGGSGTQLSCTWHVCTRSLFNANSRIPRARPLGSQWRKCSWRKSVQVICELPLRPTAGITWYYDEHVMPHMQLHVALQTSALAKCRKFRRFGSIALLLIQCCTYLFNGCLRHPWDRIFR